MSLPHVSSEGGPIILGDFDTLRGWRGVSDSSRHYDTACQQSQRANPAVMTFDSAEVVIWNFGGPGTGDIVRGRTDSHFPSSVSGRTLLGAIEQTEATIISSATARFGSAVMAHLTIFSGYLLALWAPEDLSECPAPIRTEGVPEPLSIGDGGAYVRVACGRYQVTTCRMADRAIRCYKTRPFTITQSGPNLIANDSGAPNG